MSKIEWTDVTWNPVTGCTPVSTGCNNCYAKRMHARLMAMDARGWCRNKKYSTKFNKVMLWRSELSRPFAWKKPKKIFVCSMSDLFNYNVPMNFIDKVFNCMRACYRHTFQVLTKRSGRLSYWSKYPDNMWMGVSVENESCIYRIYDLQGVNSGVRFISFEPLLGPIPGLILKGIDWVIVGGENGPGARPMHPDWARGIRDQCSSMGIPFFFKGWGGTNKKAAGRLLDGVTHNAFPKAKS